MAAERRLLPKLVLCLVSRQIGSSAGLRTLNFPEPLPISQAAEPMPSADQLAFAAAHFPPKMADNIQIERNCPDRLYQLVAQAVVDAHGWDNSAHDYGVWRRAYGPERFTLFMAVDKAQNHLVGSMSLCKHSDSLAQLSMFFVHPRYRGRRIGLRLNKEAFEEAGERSAFCYGVADMSAKYASMLGMSHFLDWRLWNLQAQGASARPERLDTDSSVELVNWRNVPFPELVAFDRLQTAGIDRADYLREALSQPDSLALVAQEKGASGRVVGICQARKLLNQRLGISLFYAENGSIASALLCQVLLDFAGPDPSQFSRLVYKTPSTNTDSIRIFNRLVDGELLSREELTPQFSSKAFALPGQRIFSIGDEHASLV